MADVLAVVAAVMIVTYVCVCAAIAWNVGGATDWVASRNLTKTIYRRNNSRKAWQTAGWIGFALGLVAAFLLLAEIVPRT